MNGLLYSQVGYDPMLPARVLVRSSSKTRLSDTASCNLIRENRVEYSTPLKYWGDIWDSHWWVAEFPAQLNEGHYDITAQEQEEVVHQGSGFHVQSKILWDSTVKTMSVEMLEIRAHLAEAKCGWMDAGVMWQESNAHSSMIIGLLDLIEYGIPLLCSNTAERIYLQIINGCEYLLKTQRKAESLGYPQGALSHDVFQNCHEILPNDANKAVVAWLRASLLLPKAYEQEKARYLSAAKLTLQWLAQEASPLQDKGLCRRQRGLEPNQTIPENEWTTRDLLMRCWGELEFYKTGNENAKSLCLDAAQKIISRQISIDSTESGYYGHFREYDSVSWSEKSWTHSIFGDEFGVDAGGTFPNYLLPLIHLCKQFPEHPDRNQWMGAIRNFTEGYLIPACMQNPFMIVPQGIFGSEGPLWFTGTFHGMNCIYGLTAALALELYPLLDKPELVTIAYANLQWLAGLNAGVTLESIQTGCHVFRADIEPGTALPYSMIYGIGNRSAGTWFATRGVICNGFSTGDQFQFDVEPNQATDGPNALSDEDWIPHSAAWLSGVVRLTQFLDGNTQNREANH